MIAPDSITTNEIKNGTITGEDVHPDGFTGANVKDGTLTQDDVAQNSLTADDLADNAVGTGELQDGAVTTDKLDVNAAQSLVNNPVINVPAVGLSGSDSSTSATITIAGGSHVVLVSGQAQITGNPAAAEVITVSAQLFDELGTPISPEYHDQITATDPTLMLAVSQLLPSATVPAPTSGTHTYSLKVTASSAALAADRTVTVTNAQVRAIDLGRS